ncbi:MAG: type II secretion system GspH family protein [Fervidobacterium sp.]|nr:type II secretion system GspH family protein [Fervidobacterium sp.]
MKKGFTLVELLIVLAVIAALMAVATPLALNAVRNAKASQVAQNFRNLKAAIENYWNTQKPTNPTAQIGTAELVPGYINAIPANFTIGTPSSVTGQPGTYSITITYSGQDVDINLVRANGMGEVTSSGNNIVLTFNLQKWW